MVSIIIYMPHYHINVFNLINSIIAQTYKTWEIIICVKMDQQFINHIFQTVSKVQSIHILDARQCSRSEIINTAVYYSIYDWIAIADMHDWWLPQKLEQQMYLTDGDLYQVIATNRISENLNVNQRLRLLSVRDITNIDFTKRNPIYEFSAIIKKKYAVWRQNYECFEDYDLFLSLKRQGCKFYTISTIFVLVQECSAYDLCIINRLYDQMLKNAKDCYDDGYLLVRPHSNI